MSKSFHPGEVKINRGGTERVMGRFALLQAAARFSLSTVKSDCTASPPQGLYCRLAERALFFLASRNLPSIQLDREEAIDLCDFDRRQNSIEIKAEVDCDKMSRMTNAISGRDGEAGEPFEQRT